MSRDTKGTLSVLNCDARHGESWWLSAFLSGRHALMAKRIKTTFHSGLHISKDKAPLKYLPLCLLTIFIGNSLFAQQKIRVNVLTSGINTSIRAMSVLNDSIVWISGSNGFVGKTTDGGKIWQWMHPDNEKLDFRSLAAFDSMRAVVANAGSPATIFLTSDGGAHWQKVYVNPDTAFFFDGMVFRNKKDGIIYGDQVNGRFLILRTKDGARHWRMMPIRRRPKAEPEEASFAASNSAIFNLPGTKYLWIGTGSGASRILFSRNFGKQWKIWNTPMLQGKSSTGIFSLAFISKSRGIAVGGDYANDAVRLNNAMLTKDGGKSWEKPIINPFGYRSCIIYFSNDTLFSTGTSGTDISTDGGFTWMKLSSMGFNVLQKAPHGKAVFLAGSHGNIARLLFPQDIQAVP